MSVYDRAERLIARSLEHLELLQAAVERTLASGEATPALVRESASVARAITGLSGELRLRERHHKQVVAAMTEEERDALIIERIRGMPRQRRDGIRRMLDDIDADESMLS